MCIRFYSKGQFLNTCLRGTTSNFKPLIFRVNFTLITYGWVNSLGKSIFLERDKSLLLLGINCIFLNFYRQKIKPVSCKKLFKSCFSKEKLFFCKFMRFFKENMGRHVVIGRYFSLFWKTLRIFLNPMLSLTVPLNNGTMKGNIH